MTEKKVVKSDCHYDSKTDEIKCDVELDDGTKHSLCAAVTATASSISEKMKRSVDEDEEINKDSS